jgi:hypothetical protein
VDKILNPEAHEGFLSWSLCAGAAIFYGIILPVVVLWAV